MPVNKERVQLLVDALESGQYEQGHNRLTTVEEHGKQLDCCLGVGCKIAIAAGLKVETVPVGIDPIEVRYDNEGSYMPPAVMEWFGFDAKDPPIRILTEDWDTGAEVEDEISASVANDDHGLTFDEIAEGFRRTYILRNEEDGA